MEKRFVYADNAATTRVSDEVVAAMLPYFTEYYGNPSAVYGFAGKAKTAIENARAQVATALGATPGEIYFVSCGTEADNWALKGTARMLAEKGRRRLFLFIGQLGIVPDVPCPRAGFHGGNFKLWGL